MDSLCCYCTKPIIINQEDAWYGLHKNCFIKYFNLKEITEFSDLIARSQSKAPLENRMNISFFNGSYRKYSARLGKNNYIMKVEQKEYPELPTCEYLSNQIFESLDIQVPNYYLIKFPEDHFCFVTKNFMSGLISSDLVHIYHFIEDKMNYDCENIVRIIGKQTKRRLEQEKFVYLTLADALIGNHDRHGRNLGFIQTPKGMSLAPFYDNPTALALEEYSMLEADLQPRGSIFTKDTNKPAMKDYINEWTRLGYSNVIELFQKKYSFEKIKTFIEKSFLSEKRKKAFLKLIIKRSEEL